MDTQHTPAVHVATHIQTLTQYMSIRSTVTASTDKKDGIEAGTCSLCNQTVYREYAANVVTDDNTQATDNKASGTAVKKGMKESTAVFAVILVVIVIVIIITVVMMVQNNKRKRRYNRRR